MAAPVVVGVGLGRHLAAGVGDEDRAARLPGRLEAEVVVDAAVGEHERARGTRRSRGRCPRSSTHVGSRRSSSKGERTGGNAEDAATASASATVGRVDAADAPVGHVGLGEAEQRAGLHARRVDDEARVVGEVLERRVAEQVLAVGLGHALGDRVGGQRAHDHRGLVDGAPGQRAHRRDERGLEPVAAASRGQARASAPAVIEPPDTLEMRSRRSSQPASCSRQITPDVEEHRPVAAAREAEARRRRPGRPCSWLRTLCGRTGCVLEFFAQPLERAAAGRADAADRHAQRRADRLVAGRALGVQQAQQRPLARRQRRPARSRTAARRSAASSISSGSTCAANSGLLHLVRGRDDALAAPQHAQALVPRGRADPGAEAVRVAQAADVLDGAQPRELGDVVGVGLAQAMRAADGADEHGVAVDELACQAWASPAAAAATSDSVSRSPRRAACRSVRDVMVVMAGTFQPALWDCFGSGSGSRITGARSALCGACSSPSTSIPRCCRSRRAAAPGSHAREEARAAYRAWAEAEEPDRSAAYTVYLAAEEREAAAARAFGVS